MEVLGGRVAPLAEGSGLRAEWTERAAILEADAGLDREEAGYRAAAELSLLVTP